MQREPCKCPQAQEYERALLDLLYNRDLPNWTSARQESLEVQVAALVRAYHAVEAAEAMAVYYQRSGV